MMTSKTTGLPEGPVVAMIGDAMKFKPRPKPKKLTAEQIDIKNRLAALTIDCKNTATEIASLLLHVAGKFGISGTVTYEILLLRGSWSIKTIQFNNDVGLCCFQAHMRYEDRTKEPLYGAIYPTKYAIISKPTLAEAATIAYLNVCKQVGRYL